MADDSRLALQAARYGELRHIADQAAILVIGGGGAGEVAGFLHQRPLGPDQFRQALGEPVADIHLVELDVAEGVAVDLLAARDKLLDDARRIGALADENRDAAFRIHDAAEPFALGLDVERELGDVDAVDRLSSALEVEFRQERELGKARIPRSRRGGGQPAAVAPHHLMDDERARAGGRLVDDVLEEDRPLLGGGQAPSDWRIGTMSLSTVFGRPTTVSW